jgi:radical SAM superfamily enzyme YgiQ (UPF0313 family)
VKFSPESHLRCLLIQPRFSSFNYWNYIDSAELIDAKTPAPPLGLLTVAALLPQHWSFQLVDLNVRNYTEEEWRSADLICVGGMLPQQTGIRDVIRKAKADGKFVAVGGADPTSQPEIYADADALVLGEGEITIPMWLDQWRNGKAGGVFKSEQKPDVSTTPIPRFDLIDFNNYVHIGVQFSRGCPFNCEFCDIIELYGRKPRTKNTDQFIAELESLYQLGYRGWVDIVDDNFIGNKRLIKKMLPELKQWCESRNYPFYFSTEASMNMTDDDQLMQMMRDVDFRFVFMGIETPDPSILLKTQKSQNTMRPIIDRVRKAYDYGILVSAGYIIGFDGEKTGTDDAMVACIEGTGTIMAMVGLLTALPNTQLTRRLHREGRLLSPEGQIVDNTKELNYRVTTEKSFAQDADQTSGGLNFVTTRDRVEVYDEYLNVIQSVYSPKAFMNRILKTTMALKPRRKHWAKGWELKRNLKGMWRSIKFFSKDPRVRWLYWRNFVLTLLMGPQKFESAQTMTSMFIHVDKQSKFLIEQIRSRREGALKELSFPRMIQPPPPDLKIAN